MAKLCIVFFKNIISETRSKDHEENDSGFGDYDVGVLGNADKGKCGRP
jgi:hypothetical protein